MEEARISRRSVLGAATAALISARAAAAEGSGTYASRDGDDATFIGGGAGDTAKTLTIQAEGDLNVGAGHLRMGTQDGNYEFEHSKDVPETHLNSYYIGTPTRTPISVGGDDGQDVTPSSSAANRVRRTTCSSGRRAGRRLSPSTATGGYGSARSSSS